MLATVWLSQLHLVSLRPARRWEFPLCGSSKQVEHPWRVGIPKQTWICRPFELELESAPEHGGSRSADKYLQVGRLINMSKKAPLGCRKRDSDSSEGGLPSQLWLHSFKPGRVHASESQPLSHGCG